MLHKVDFKASFRMPKFVPISTFFGLPVSHACLLWVAVIFSDNRSTRLLPKGPFELLKRIILPKFLGILSSKLAHYHDPVFLSFKPISQGLCIRKLLVLELLTQKRFNLWKHENMTEKVVQLGTESRWWVRVFLLGILFVSNHRNCSRKDCVRHLLSIRSDSELLLNADQSRKSVLHRLVLIIDSTSQARPRRH